MTTGQHWENWARTESADPTVVEPATVEEVARLVADAAATGRRLKPIGAGHSFSGIGVPADIQVHLAGLRGVIAADADARLVTLAAGTHLHEIPGLLAPLGLAMANLGDVDRQTISGATSTGTHGTGLGFGGISTQIAGATLVNGRGELVHLGADEPDLSAVALGLGALGVLVDITLRCVPAFNLEAVEAPAKLPEVLAGWGDSLASIDHYEFYWFPHTDCCLTKSNTRLPAATPASGPPGCAAMSMTSCCRTNSSGCSARWAGLLPRWCRPSTSSVAARSRRAPSSTRRPAYSSPLATCDSARWNTPFRSTRFRTRCARFAR